MGKLSKEEEEKAKKEKEEKEAKEKKEKEGEGKYTLEQVVTAIQQLAGAINTTNQKVSAIEESNKAAGKRTTPKKEDDKEVNLETLTRKEFVDHIFEQAEDRFVKPLREEQRTEKAESSKKEVAAEIKAASEAYSDFLDFKDEIKDVLAERPQLNIEDAYHVARGRNKDKASQVDAAAAKVAKEKEEKDQKKKGEEFGGLLPTSGKATKNQNMGFDDASESAWEESGMDEHLAGLPN